MYKANFKNKKVLLVSYFRSCNIGDILIAQTLQNMLAESCDLVCCNVDGSPVESAQLIQPCDKALSVKSLLLKSQIVREAAALISTYKNITKKRILSLAEDCDTVIFAGGNMIMELGFFPTGVYKLSDTVTSLSKLGKKVIFAFCGVGPFRTRFYRKYLKNIVDNCKLFAARDEYSKSQIISVVPEKEIEIWCDPVLSLNKQIDRSKADAIGVNVYFGCDKKNKKGMCHAFIKTVSDLRSTFPKKKIILFSSELTDRKDIETVKNAFNEDSMVEVGKVSSIEELFLLYERISICLTCRMHTAITSAVSAVPMVTISWQPKVKSLMKHLRSEKYNVTNDDFIKEKFDIVKLLFERLEDTNGNSKMFETLSDIKRETALHISKLLEEI